MPKPLKIVLPIAVLLLAAFFLRNAFTELAKWREWLLLGDTSGAELYELGFQMNLAPSIALFTIAGFLAGRWWFRSRG